MRVGKFVPLLAAAMLTLSLAAPAFADGGGSTPAAVTGTISAASATSITIGTSAYNFASSVTVVFRDHRLTTSEIPTNVQARVFLDSNGNVDRVVLSSDPNIPSGESYWGTVGTVSQGTIQIGSFTLNLAPTVTVKYHDRRLPIADVTSGLTAKVALDRQGDVQTIVITQDPNIPKGESASGTISAVSSTSITIGTYTLAISSNAEVRFHDHVLTVGEIPTGVQAKVNIDSNLEVTKIMLRSDPNLPNGNTATGVISAVYGSSLTIGSYNLTLSNSVTVQFHSYRLSLSQIPTGVQAKAKLDGRTGEVTKIKLWQDPSLPSSRSLSGSVASVSGSTISIGSYTLNVDPAAEITYKGQTQALSGIQPGWTVKVKLSQQGVVERIKIKSGPAQNSSGGQSGSGN